MTQKILVWKSCKTCKALKKQGMCRKKQCVDISSSRGQRLAKQAKVTNVPQCITIDSRTGKAKKCNTGKIIKRFLK